MTLDDVKVKHDEERALIAYVKANEQFTYADLRSEVPGSQWRRENLVNRLIRMKLLFNLGRSGGVKIFSRHDQTDKAAIAKGKRQSPTGVMWAAMRSLTVFTPDEVLAIAQASKPLMRRTEVQLYCTDLVRGNYLAVEERAQSGGRPARYRLGRDTGPIAPANRQLKCLVDGNTGKVAYIAGNRL